MIHRAKKSLGQNFLNSKKALNTMCETSEVSKKDTILEIGPGKGALTEFLLEKAGKVLAIEKDEELFEFLNEKFVDSVVNGKLILINKDILDIDLSKYNIKNGEYKIVANIPYNITGAILKNFLTNKNRPKSMTLLVQKEVAERIIAKDKKESILSLSVKVYGDPKFEMKVSKGSFSPVPKVDSAIINIRNISNKNLKSSEAEKLFFELIKNGFAHKRKVLYRNIENILKKYSVLDHQSLEMFGIQKNTRAEDLKLEDWTGLTNFLLNKN